MKLEIPLPSIPWKRVLLVSCLVAPLVYWGIAVRPYLHLNDATLRAGVLELSVPSPGSWEEGDAFKKGDVLAAPLQNKEPDAQLRISQASLAQERMHLDAAMQAYVRAQTEGQGSEAIDAILERIRHAQQAIAVAESETLRLQEELASAQELLAEQAVLAPFDGLVLRTFQQSGQPMLTICERGKLWVEAHIPEQWLGSLKPGMSAEVSFPSFAGRTWPATVERISPVVEQGRVKVRLSASDLPVQPGLTAHVVLRVR